MQWAAWVTASNYDFPLSGYTPSKADYAKRKRLEKIYGPLGEEETTAQKRAPRLR
jgi:hypothetical protein